ncbi:MAG: hypothetical protein U0800_17755 [Isosphaeraceae bacterium]
MADAATCADFAEICEGLGLPIESRDWHRAAVRIDPTRQSSQAALARLTPIVEVDPIPPGSVPPSYSAGKDGPWRPSSAGLSAGLADRAEERASDSVTIRAIGATCSSSIRWAAAWP